MTGSCRRVASRWPLSLSSSRRVVVAPALLSSSSIDPHCTPFPPREQLLAAVVGGVAVALVALVALVLVPVVHLPSSSPSWSWSHLRPLVVSLRCRRALVVVVLPSPPLVGWSSLSPVVLVSQSYLALLRPVPPCEQLLAAVRRGCCGGRCSCLTAPLVPVRLRPRRPPPVVILPSLSSSHRCRPSCPPLPSSSLHPQSTPRAVAHEAGGGWCVVPSSSSAGPVTPFPPCEQVLAAADGGAVLVAVVIVVVVVPLPVPLVSAGPFSSSLAEWQGAGCLADGGRPHPRPLAPAIHLASSGSQGWGRVLGRWSPCRLGGCQNPVITPKK